jgi:hypothetical protein
MERQPRRRRNRRRVGDQKRPDNSGLESPRATIGFVFTDTNADVREVQLSVYRKMSGAQRMLLAFEMSAFARDLSRTRIQQLHPEWNHAEISRELLRLAFSPRPLPALFR